MTIWFRTGLSVHIYQSEQVSEKQWYLIFAFEALSDDMVDTTFQLGLELTNILNPLTSALGSVALIKAIRDAGSDALTELELASYLGRNRLDKSLELHFRQIVGGSEQTNLSRHLDIVIGSGAGPTVQNALKTPELMSMVVQLSALCFVHESQPLAQALVEAIERNLLELKTDRGKVPHYSSLSGTIRVCKQETASFQWEPFFDAVETKIESILGDNPPKQAGTGRKWNRKIFVLSS